MEADAGEAAAEPVHGHLLLGPSAREASSRNNRLWQANLIERLRQEQQALTKQKKLLSQQLKNERRKRQRIKQKAKQLSNEDLVAVLAGREAVAAAKAKAKARSRSDSGR